MTRVEKDSATIMSPYPNAYQIEEIFAARTQPEKFHEYMADPVDVMVIGEGHEVAGHYKSIEEFNEKIFARISDTVKRESIRLEVKRVIGGGESAVRLTFSGAPFRIPKEKPQLGSTLSERSASLTGNHVR